MRSFLDGLVIILSVLARIVVRVGCLGLVFLVYFVQLVALMFRKKILASSLLALGSRLVLRALGVQVFVLDESNSLVGKAARPRVYLYNHQNPLDVFVIQGYLRIPSLTTAGLHLGLIFPWFSLILIFNDFHCVFNDLS